MTVHLIKKLTIQKYAEANAQSRVPFELWLAKVKYADWNKPADIMHTFSSADLLGHDSNRVVFDIGGNNYRMICKYQFMRAEVRLYIKWIGTHKGYDRLCSNNNQYSIDTF